MIGRRSLLDLHLDSELAQHASELSAEFRRPVSGLEVLVLRAALEDVEEHEWTYVKSNGEQIVVAVSVTALRDEDGAIHGFLHVGTDITARKQAEEMLRKQAAAITASMDGIGILNERLEFTYLNDSLAKLFGYPDSYELIGRSLCDLYEPHEQVRYKTTAVALVQQGGRFLGV
jgi:PAS domain-containing protein